MSRCMRCMTEYDLQKFCPCCGRERDSGPAFEEQLPEGTVLNSRFVAGEARYHDRIGFLYTGWDNFMQKKVFIREWYPVKISERDGNGLTVKPLAEEALWDRLNELFLVQASRFQNPDCIKGVIPGISCFRENNTAYYVLEYVDGMTLQEFLQRENPLDLPLAKEITGKVNRILEEFHRRNMVHGNISPENIFITDKGEIRLLNPAWFGSDMDSIRYMVFWSRYAPVSYREPPVNPGPDIDRFQTASVFYRMITGEEPYGVLREEKKERLPSVWEYGIEIPEKLDQELMEALGEKYKRKSLFLRKRK